MSRALGSVLLRMFGGHGGSPEQNLRERPQQEQMRAEEKPARAARRAKSKPAEPYALILARKHQDKRMKWLAQA